MKEDTNKFTETEKLLTSGKNAERLLKSVGEVQSGKLNTKDFNVLQDQSVFLIHNENFDAFESSIEANPITDNKKLADLLARTKIWK